MLPVTAGIVVSRWRLEDMGYVMSGPVKNTTPAKTLTMPSSFGSGSNIGSNVTFLTNNNLSYKGIASSNIRAIWPSSNDVVASYDPLSTGDVYRVSDKMTTMSFPYGVTAVSVLIDCETTVNGTATVTTNASNFSSMPLNTSNSQGPPWGHWVGFYSTTNDYIKSLSWNNNNNTVTDFVDLQLSQSPPNSNTVWETPAATASNEYPPVPLVHYDRNTVNGTTGVVRDGVYTLSSSTMSKPNCFAFDKRMRTEWASIPGAYNSTTGSNLLGVTTQEASNVGINPWIGQWIQVSLPSNIALTSYTISPPAFLGHCPTDWSLVGTTDGLDGWKALSLQSNITWSDSNPKSFTLTGFNPCFKSYRMVIPKTQTWNTDGSAAIGELKLFSGTVSVNTPFSSFGRTGTLGTIWGPSNYTVTNANSTAVTTWSTSGGPPLTALTGISGTGCTLNVPYGGYSNTNFRIVVTADGLNSSTYDLSVGYSNTYIPPTYAFGTVWHQTSNAISQANVSTGNVTWGILNYGGISNATITGASNAGSILNIPYIPHSQSNAVQYSNIVVTATGANNVASTETCSISMGASASISGSNLGTILAPSIYTINQINNDTGDVTWSVIGGPSGTALANWSAKGCDLSVPYYPGVYTITVTATGANGVNSVADYLLTAMDNISNNSISNTSCVVVTTQITDTWINDQFTSIITMTLCLPDWRVEWSGASFSWEGIFTMEWDAPGGSGTTLTNNIKTGGTLRAPYAPGGAHTIQVTLTGDSSVVSTIETFTNASITGSSLGSFSAATTYNITQTNANSGSVNWVTTGGPTNTTLSNQLSTGCMLSVPYVPGAYTITVTATGANGVPCSASYTLTMNASTTTASITGASLGPVLTATTYTYNITQTNANSGSVNWVTTGGPTNTTLSNQLSTGCTLSVPYIPGAYTIIVTATGVNGVPCSASYTLTINTFTTASITGSSLGSFSAATTYNITQTNVNSGAVNWVTTGGPTNTMLSNQLSTGCTLSVPLRAGDLYYYSDGNGGQWSGL